MKKFGLVSRSAAAVTLALASWCVHAADEAASAPKEGARPEVANPLKEADALRQQKKWDEALAKVKQAQGVANLTPYETFFIWRMQAAIGLGSDNAPLAIDALTHAVDAGRFSPDEQKQALMALTDLYYRGKDYPHAIDSAQRYFKAGGTDAAAHQELTNALYLSGNYAAAVPELQASVKADEAAGKVPSEQLLRMLASAQAKVSDDTGYESTVEKLVAHYPKPELWADLASRVQTAPGFADYLRLDAYRLRRATGLLKNADQYVEMAQLALQAGYPEEASKVLDEGYSRSLLGSGGSAKQHDALRAQAKRAAASDAASLAQSSGTSSKSADALANMGFALATAGQPDKGIPMLEQAVAKGGLKHPDMVKLHLGVAQAMAGQKDAALRTLQGVQGNDGSAGLAHLWVLHLQAPTATAATKG